MQTLPKAQRTRGLSSAYQSNEILHKSWSNFEISTEHQHFDQTLTSKSWPNIHFITSPSLSSKILTKLQFQKFALTSTSNSWPNLVLKVGTKLSFMTKLQLPNLHKTVVKIFVIINISNSNNLNKFWVGIFTSHTTHQSSLLNRSQSVSQLVSRWVTSITNDRTRVR